MSSAANPLEPALTELFRRAHVLYGLLHVLSSQLDVTKKQLRAAIDKKVTELPTILTSVSLAVIDLTGKTDHGWPLNFAAGGFSAADAEYIEALDAVLARNASWAESQTYEAFETFLKDVLACFLTANPSEAKPADLSKFNMDAKSSGLTPASFEYWRGFVSYIGRGRNNSGFFKLARRFAPNLSMAEESNQLGLNLPDWFAAASEMRHAVTHADFEVEPNRWDPLSQNQKTLLQLFFPCRIRNGKRMLAATVAKAEQAIRMFLQYAFTVFKFLSMSKSYDWDIFSRGFRIGSTRP